MGLSLTKYPAIDAKLKGMYAKQLNKNDLLELSKQPDVISVISSLKSKFSPLESIRDKATRVEVEDALDNVLIEDINKIKIYLSNDEQKIFSVFISKYEIKCLKSILKNLISSSKIESNTADVDVWVNKIFKNIQGIATAQTIPEYIDSIQKSDYSKIIEELVSKDNIPIFELETKLDKEYFLHLYRSIQNKSKEVKNIVGTRIDTLNIIWILRAKKYYSLSNEELKNLLIPIYYNLRKSNIEELIDANSFDEIQTILSKTIYKKFANSTEESIEKDIKIYLKHQYEKILSQNKFDLSFVFSYIYLSEYQKSNVVHILGGIYYHLDKNKIESDLII